MNTNRRRPLSLWIVAAVFVGAAVLVVACYSVRQRQRWRQLPRDLSELSERIKSKHPQWHVIPDNAWNDSVEKGFWGSSRLKTRELAGKLSRRLETVSEWQGTIYCGKDAKELAEAINDPHVFYCDRFVIFGDSEIVKDVTTLLR